MFFIADNRCVSLMETETIGESTVDFHQTFWISIVLDCIQQSLYN